MNDQNDIIGETLDDASRRLLRWPSRRVRMDAQIILDALKNSRNWPERIHKQYLTTLDERDSLQEQLDAANEKIRRLNEILYINAKQIDDWQGEGGSLDYRD